MDYQGTLFGTADKEGFFLDITHFATLLLYDNDTLLASNFFKDSISGTNTTILRPNQGTLRVSYELEYGKNYWLFAEADSEIYGYTVPEPNTSLLLLVCAPALLLRLSNKRNAAG